MQAPKTFLDYTDSVCQHIRWKKARPMVAHEIKNHMCDQYESLVENGMSEEEAINETVRQMGDSTEVGKQLNIVHRPKVAYEILGIIAIMLIIGWVLNSYFTASGDFLWRPENNTIILIFGMLVMTTAYFGGAHLIERFPSLVLIVIYPSELLCLMVPWMNYYFQYLSLLFPVVVAAFLYRLKDKGLFAICLTWTITVIFSVLCIVRGSIFGMVLSVLATMLLTVLASKDGWLGAQRVKMIIIACVMFITVTAAVVLFFSLYSPLNQHFSIAMNPSQDPDGAGYQPIIVRSVISEAGLWGNATSEITFKGINSDFMLAWLISKFGWVAFAVIILVVSALLGCSFVRCIKQKSFLGRGLSLAVVVSVSLQVLFYILTNLGYDLVRSISLPLISYGGTGTVVNMLLIGIMLSVFRSGSVIRDAFPMYKQYTIGSIVCKSDTVALKPISCELKP